jgi:hypothetical protein
MTAKPVMLLEAKTKVEVVSQDSLWSQVKFIGGSGYLQTKSLMGDLGNIKQVVASKGDNIISIETNDSLAVAFKKLVILMRDNGYIIENTDKELSSLQAKQTVAKSGEIKINAYVKEGMPNVIIMQGDFNPSTDISMYVGYGVGVSSNGSYPIENRGGKGSPIMAAWEKMNDVAKAYPEGKVLYSKK